MPLRHIIAVIVFLWSVTSCADTANKENAAKQANTKVFTACSEPRPQLCTSEYNPACAKLKDSSMKTYATGCTACSDQNVSGYYPGACEP